jgi:ribosomal protein L13E
MIQNSLLPSQFFTIGYEGLGIKRFLEILKENQVKTLVDVRHNPYSMNKDFIRKFLMEHLQQNGIKYEHLKDWGIASKIRKEGNAMEWYVQNVKPNISKNILEGLEQPVCFMCMENDIGNCHRQVILETLRGQGLDGRDLAPKLDPKQAALSKPKISSGWDEHRFFKKLDENISNRIISSEGALAVGRLYDASKNLEPNGKAAVGWGTGKAGSFVVFLPALTGSKMLYKMDSEGTIQIAVDNLPEEKRQNFLYGLKDIKSLEGCFKKPQGNYYIKMDKFKPALDEFMNYVRAL